MISSHEKRITIVFLFLDENRMSVRWNYEIEKYFFSPIFNSELSSQSKLADSRGNTCTIRNCWSVKLWFHVLDNVGARVWPPCKWAFLMSASVLCVDVQVLMMFAFSLENAGIVGILAIHITQKHTQDTQIWLIHMQFSAALPGPQLKLIMFLSIKAVFWKQKVSIRKLVQLKRFLPFLCHFFVVIENKCLSLTVLTTIFQFCPLSMGFCTKCYPATKIAVSKRLLETSHESSALQASKSKLKFLRPENKYKSFSEQSLSPFFLWGRLFKKKIQQGK